jgi:putative hydrolase of the HAD superfamily
MRQPRFKCILFDWGDTLMSEDGPQDLAMGLWAEVRAIDGARETLETLAPDHRLGIATNAVVSSRLMIERALARVSLDQYITDIFAFSELGVRKDTPEFWSYVFSSLALRPEEIAIVGDTLEQDVIAPRKHGVFSIWFNATGKTYPAADGYPAVSRLPEVVPILIHGV